MNLREVNQALCTMLGYIQTELLAKSLIDLVDEADRSMFLEQVAHASVTNHHHYELVLITSQGNKLHTSVYATTIRNDRGDVQDSFALITDITERKQAEANLRLSEEH
ncbi:PAS domain-containing protein [Pantanalinema sp. GBBB05]|uniref:PAS domain-containing protein n=1 Tax=Pantanalinema sp. GBBB05 TaxID=2604139 RepID=UPI001D494C66|nr:PAS domain S-box protein [Pantanalinema sp. GBBB05]